MYKRYSEYFNYQYKDTDDWFNPLVGCDTQLFIDPILLKKCEVPELRCSYNKIVEFFSKAIAALEKKNIPYSLKKEMLKFDEVKEANLGYSSFSNGGSGLTGKLSISIMSNLKKYTDCGLFNLDEFYDIAIFDSNVSCDRLTDMVLNIAMEDFIKYSCRIAKENGFATKTVQRKIGFDFEHMVWNIKNIEVPYVIDKDGKLNIVVLVPKSILVADIYSSQNNFIDWVYHTNMEYIKDEFNYTLKKDIFGNKDKIINDIINNNRKDLISSFKEHEGTVEAYNLDEDNGLINSIYEKSYELYNKVRFKYTNGHNGSNCSVVDIVKSLIDDLEFAIVHQKGIEVITDSKGKLISEVKISKFIHIFIEARIKDAGYNVDISPEVNKGYGPVDFKISRGDDIVIMENKKSSNSKLSHCLDETGQVTTYMLSENTRTAFLLVFYDNNKDIEKINNLYSQAASLKPNYDVSVKPFDCTKHLSASKR